MENTPTAAQREAKRIETMKIGNLYPFVDDPCETWYIKNSGMYELWEKSIVDPKSLTRGEKDEIARRFASQVYYTGGNGIAVRGWLFIFPTAKKYLVQDEDNPRSYYAYYGFDKTSVHKATMNRHGEIIECKEK